MHIFKAASFPPNPVPLLGKELQSIGSLAVTNTTSIRIEPVVAHPKLSQFNAFLAGYECFMVDMPKENVGNKVM